MNENPLFVFINFLRKAFTPVGRRPSIDIPMHQSDDVPKSTSLSKIAPMLHDTGEHSFTTKKSRRASKRRSPMHKIRQPTRGRGHRTHRR